MTQSLLSHNRLWTPARVTEIKDSSSRIRHIWLKPARHISYKPGQNIEVELPIDAPARVRKRTYAIANMPSPDGTLEICVPYIEGGQATEYLYKELVPGQELRIRGPLGRFTLPDKIDKDLVFIAIGTALAPARAMIHYIFAHNLPHKQIHLIFGSRSPDSILCASEFISLATKYSEFRYSFSYSQAPNSSGQPRYVHEIYMEEYAEPRPDILFYVSGSPRMIEETVENLQRLGYAREQIKYEMI